MDYIEIIKWIAIILLGAISIYLKKYTNVTEKIAELIATAEKEYIDYSNAGEQKMAWCINQLNIIIPKVLKPILTDEILETLVQSVFDQVKIYADIQKQKLADKINKKME